MLLIVILLQYSKYLFSMSPMFGNYASLISITKIHLNRNNDEHEKISCHIVKIQKFKNRNFSCMHYQSSKLYSK